MTMLPDLHFVHWDDFHQMGFELAKQVKELRPESCTIVSVSRGGHALARILSDFLKLPIFSVSIQSYTDLQQHELKITQELNVDLRGRHVLLVDEVIDSGKTLVRALEYLEDFDLESVTSVAMHVKPGCIRKSDFYVSELSEWIVYPYEVRETIEALRPIWQEHGGGDEALRAVLTQGGIPANWVNAFL